MTAIIEVLKSRGKIGGVGLMVVGLGMVVYSYFKGAGQYQEGMVTFFLGLGIVGIRGKQDK
jgi:hypothetical protein